MFSTLKRIAKSIATARSTAYYKRIRSRLRNTNPTIIASDCFGTFVYHNMGLRFNSPTINLFITSDDFLLFVENLQDFLSVDVQEVSDSGVNYPIGKLEYNGKTCKIRFMHYETFEQAREKWNERKTRVDFDNMYIILLISHGITNEIFHRFECLPFRNKMLITDRNPWGSPLVVTHKIFHKKNYKPGEILSRKWKFSKKRNMDDIDYIGFLNKQ